MITVVPSLPAQSFEEIKTLAENLTNTATELQVDIVDGKFVPAFSWPFTENDPLKELRRIKELPIALSVELDCMVIQPEQYLDLFVELGVQRVIVHMRSTKRYDDILEHAYEHGYTLGFAFTNDVPFSEIEPFIEAIDFVQIMGIAQVGKQGLPFDTRTLDTARMLRDRYPDLVIAVDGSVNKETIVPLKAAGVNRFAPGSAVAKQADQKAAYLALLKMVL